MKPTLDVRVRNFTVLRELPGVRASDDYVALLQAMEFEDTANMDETELREMCLMSLQDRPAEAAATLVLQHDLGSHLRPGQIRNLSTEMLDDKLWEEYADLSLHEALFNVGSLLFAAFPGSFPQPDAVQVQLEIVAKDSSGRESLSESSRESFVVRLLADGMGEDSALHRLFDEQLAGKKFPEADQIVWRATTEQIDLNTATLDVISSGYWLDGLREVQSYSSAARADG